MADYDGKGVKRSVFCYTIVHSGNVNKSCSIFCADLVDFNVIWPDYMLHKFDALDILHGKLVYNLVASQAINQLKTPLSLQNAINIVGDKSA